MTRRTLSSSASLSSVDNRPAECLKAASPITTEEVQKVLLADRGPDAQLISWDLANFTKKGDNYDNVVVALEVKYTVENKEINTSYVAKYNPDIGSESSKNCIRIMSAKESQFYTKFVPEANELLRSCGQGPLHSPQCFHSTLVAGKEQIFLEDLRPRQFRMIDKSKGMDVAHAELVLKELAKLHASSLLLQKKYPQPLEIRYENISTNLYALSSDLVRSVFGSAITSSITMLKNLGGYEKAIPWLDTVNSEMEDILTTKAFTHRYDVINHGDCWSNNTLFRYDSENMPTEVMLIDLQVSRKASPACDLSYFMYSSLNSDVRKSNRDLFLSLYYNTFKEVLEAGDMAMPFSMKDLMEDLKNQKQFAAITAMFFLSIINVTADPQDDQDHRGDFDAFENMYKKAIDLFTSNEMFRTRFLDTINEFMEEDD